MSGIHVTFDVSPEEFLCELTKGAYAVALKHGFQASFIEVELDMQEALREVLKKNTLVSEACGSHECRKASRFKIDSPEAKKIFPRAS